MGLGGTGPGGGCGARGGPVMHKSQGTWGTGCCGAPALCFCVHDCTCACVCVWLVCALGSAYMCNGAHCACARVYIQVYVVCKLCTYVQHVYSPMGVHVNTHVQCAHRCSVYTL